MNTEKDNLITYSGWAKSPRRAAGAESRRRAAEAESWRRAAVAGESWSMIDRLPFVCCFEIKF